MGLRFQHSNQPWRKTLHTLICICVVLSNVLSLLAVTPQAVQAATPLPQMEKSAGNKVKSPRPAPVAHAANAPITGANTGQIKGTVFQDYNSNGVMDTTGNATNPAIDVGVAGITVKAYDATGTQVGATVTTAADGSYTISSVTDGTMYRVEFSNLPSGYESSFHSITTGTASGTSVQFVSGGSGNVSFGINQPLDYSQANPTMATNLLINGDINTTSPTDTLVKFSYNDTGTSPAATSLATKSQVGATWGLAYARSTGVLYSSAFVKRHVGLGLDGLGAIYATNVNSGSTTLFANLATLGANLGSVSSNSARGLGNPTSPNNDAGVFDQVGKVGLGDIDISDDGSTLYVVSLNDQKLYALNVPAGTLAGSYSIADPGCTGGAWRPFGAKFWRGDVYVGGVCDAQTSQSTSDLKAYVLRFTPGANTFNQVLTFPLNYAKGDTADNSCTGFKSWLPWIATLPGICRVFGNADFYVHPQPVLSDIEFDVDGSMILGFLDRLGHQVGYDNYKLVGTSRLERGVTGGDILRAYNNNGSYVLENNGQAGSVTTAGANNGDGPGNGEFYFGDSFASNHYETSDGGLALLPGRGEVAATAMDPFSYDSGGVYWFNNTTGAAPRKYQIYLSSSFNPSTFGKAAGLGDLELLLDPAPLEIGNRVWLDANEDGIQDPGETSLSGVTVALTDASGKQYTTVTNAEGAYYFNGSNVTSGLQPNSAYTLTIDTTQAALKNYDLTTANANSGSSLPDGSDSDATMVGALAQINLTTGSAGQNDHTQDFGFHLVELSLGNRLWYDTNNDGLDNDGVGGGLGAGIAGVTIQLLNATNTVIATTLTDAAGYYRFDKLPPGAYTVVISTSNFASGGLLENYQNSTPTFNMSTDANDNGTVNGTLGSGGDVRAAVTLTDLALPTGETSVGGGTNGPQGDVDDDLTVDFGFYKLTLGNRVWIDTNRDGLDGQEPGAASIPVTLTTSAGVVVATTTTDANGYYTFTNLISGTYVVQITAPTGYLSTSPDDATNNTDLNDNGQGMGVGVISSQPFALTPGLAAGDITVNAPSGHTRNLTMDFSIYQPTADLQVLKSVTPLTYTVSVATPVTFTVVITNYGPVAVVNTPVTDTQSANVTFDSWTCTILNPGSGAGPNACGAASGSGDILTTVSLRAGASAVWTVNAIISAAATSVVTNTVSEALTPDVLQGTGNRADQANANVVPAQPLFSVGNRVWLDTNNNRVVDGTEVGVPNILMQLVDLATGQVIQTTNTGSNGYYRFDGVTAGAYEIVVAASNFNTPQATGYRNSSGVITTTTNITSGLPITAFDDHDHGINSAAPTGIYGVHSVPFLLGPGLQPTGEVAAGGGNDGPYGDANSNLTIDFGFNKQHTGNQLWYDTNNNGIFDTGELPVPAGVVVVMHAVIGGIDIGPVFTTTTDANGQYDFAAGSNADLSVGSAQLYVAIPPGQPALNSYGPSTGVRHDGGGVDNENTGAINASGVITSGLFFPVAGSTANGAVVNDAAGSTYKPTIDFGFVLQTYTLGNRVWLDTNNNGLFDVNEKAVPGGTLLELLNSSGDIISTTVTTAGGYYSFTNLLAGTYEVAISAKNFVGPGAGYQDSTSMTAPSSNVADDNHDHGINVAKPGVTSIRSGPITLGPGLQPTSESDGVHGPTGDANDNLTIDFGFYKLTLGNIIWADDNNDGLFDATSEDGIDGVTVRLFASDGVTEIPVGADGVLGTADDALGGMVTSNGGQYTFTGLTPGDYIVKAKLPAGDTSSSGINASLTGSYEPAPDTNNNLDNDDNGVNATGADDGWAVTLPVNLTPGATGAATNNVVNYNAGSTINPTVDIGMFHELALGNLIWNDVNNNGIFDSGTESSIDGVQVNLYFDTNNNNVIDTGETTPIATTTTAGGGLYLFSDLVPGNYMVELDASNFTAGSVLENYTSSTGTNGSVSGPYETAPDPELSSVDNDDNGSVNGVLGSGGSIRTQMVNLEEGHEPTNENPNNDTDAIDTSDNLTIDFGVFRYASLGDYTWVDLNKNGVQESGEPPLAGVTVQLYTNVGVLVAATATDATGLYTFTNLLPADYYVVFTPPAGFTLTQQDTGGDDTRDSDANSQTGIAATTSLALDEFDRTWDAGFISLLALGNLVWYDANNNGKVDNGEYGIPHVAVELYQDTNGDNIFSAGDTLISTTTTSASGFYSFTNLLPTISISTTYLVVIPSTNFANNGVLNNYQNSSGTVPITNTLNSQDNGIDGTLNASATSGFIASRVFTLTLGAHEIQPFDDGDNPPSGTQLSGPFTGVTDNLPYPNNTNWTVDFGFYKLTLGNQIWYDSNNNGLYEPSNGENGLQGITVTLLSGGAPVLTTTTDANGVYTFTGLISGTYQVRIMAPSNLVSSQDTANSSATSNADSNDKGPGTTGQVITSQPFPLIPGNPSGAITVSNPTGTTFNPTLDFGLIQFVEIGNRLWIESDNDGDATTGSTSPVVGQIVTATSGTGTVYTATTDANGLYTITVPANDVYTVTTNTPVGTVPSTVITSVANDSNAAANNDKNHRNTGTIVSVETTDNRSVDFGFNTPLAQFGDRVWLESDTDGLASTGVITPIAGLTITATDSQGVAHTTTTDVAGYYSFTLVAGAYTVTYGAVPASYGVTTPSNTPEGNSEAGNAGLYKEAGNPDQSHVNGTTVTVASGQANWYVDFGFHNLVEIGNRLWIEDDTDGNATTGTAIPVVGQVVTVTSSSGTVYTTTTDVNGLYTVTVPANATYTVTTATPAGTVPSLFSGTPGDNQSHTPTGTTVTVGTTNDYTIDFGFNRPLAQFGDRVWLESDTDGDAATGTVAPVAGMTITATDSTHSYVTTTDAAGYYSITVPAGTYTVTYGAVPANYGTVMPSSTPGGNSEGGNAGLYAESGDPDQSHSNGTTVTVADGQANWHIDFGFHNLVQIGNRLWIENDTDGDATTGTVTPVVGQIVTVTSSTGMVYTTTTDANGFYTVTVPANDTYTVTTGTPKGTTPSVFNGTPGDNQSHTPTGTGVSVGSTNDLTVDFGFFIPASIGNYVWLDKDVDGVQDTGEPAVPGVAVALFKADGSPATDVNGQLVAPQTTDANGTYQFTNLPPGAYYIQFTPPANYFISPQDQGADEAVDSDANPTTGKTAVNTLSSGEQDISWDLGLYQGAALGNYVWDDKNGNGLQDAGEPGLPAVTVTLYNSTNSAVATTQTDAQGYYGFSSLTPGDYSIQFTTPTGYVPTRPNQGSDDTIDSDAVNGHTAVTTLANGEHDTTWDAGFTAPATISSYVWNDGTKGTADGIKTPEEPGVPGVTVILLDVTGQEIAHTVTDQAGFFQFTNVVPGSYIIKFVTPTDTEFTQVVPNANDNSAANPTTGETIVVTLQPGQVAISWNAGLVSVPTALDTEPEPSRSTINIYLPDIKNETQAAEGRSGFKKPRLTPKP